jgi:hypothetical protein
MVEPRRGFFSCGTLLTAMNPPPTDEQIAWLRRRLLDKGAEINAKLVALLSGKQVNLEALVGGGKPGETKEERLRRFLNLIDSKLVAIRNRTYGRCEKCGDGLPYAELEQMPWNDTCDACAGKEA